MLYFLVAVCAARAYPGARTHIRCTWSIGRASLNPGLTNSPYSADRFSSKFRNQSPLFNFFAPGRIVEQHWPQLNNR
jgi:hypothetical protein